MSCVLTQRPLKQHTVHEQIRPVYSLKDHYEQIRPEYSLKDHYEQIRPVYSLKDHYEQIRPVYSLKDHKEQNPSCVFTQRPLRAKYVLCTHSKTIRAKYVLCTHSKTIRAKYVLCAHSKSIKIKIKELCTYQWIHDAVAEGFSEDSVGDGVER